jgi:hypothetical protein
MKKTLGRFAAIGLALTLASAPVFAQTTNAQGGPDAKAKDNTLKPPTPSKPDDPPVVMTYLAVLLTIGLIAGAALVPSKRGHQD